MFQKLQLQNHVDGASFPPFFQKVENGMNVGRQVASKWQAGGKRVQNHYDGVEFLSISTRLRTECMLAGKWRASGNSDQCSCMLEVNVMHEYFN